MLGLRSKMAKRQLFSLWQRVLLGGALFLCPMTSWAESAGPVALSDEELGEITAGATTINVQVENDVITLEQGGEMVTLMQGNLALDFLQGIGGNAFRGAEGVMATVQAVNSVIDLDVIVNIYLNGV